MTSENPHRCTMHPMVIFWLGVLTGALVMGMVLLVRYMNAVDYQSAILKVNPKHNYSQQLDKKSTPKAQTLPQTMEKLTPEAFGEASPLPTP